MLVQIVEQKDGWIANITDRPHIAGGFGITPDAALGRLIRNVPRKFGIKVLTIQPALPAVKEAP